MTIAASVCHIQGVASASVCFSLSNQAGPERAAPSMDVMDQTPTAEIKLPRAFPVGSKLNSKQVLTGRASIKKITIFQLTPL